MSKALRLYGFPTSTNCRRVRFVAEALGLPLEDVLVDLLEHEQETSDYQDLNPTGRVPALVHGDVVIFESNAICLYLCEIKDRLLPSDLAGRAAVHQWLSWRVGHLAQATEPLQFERFVKPAFGLGATDPRAEKAAETKLHRELAALEAALDGRTTLVGEDTTVADLAVAADFACAEPARFPLETYPNVQAWLRRHLGTEAWSRSDSRVAEPA